ncbi:MAG TPA: PKD domain-containing protein [Planctomycetota bacterium]|nr:PKD domain-containing protein [Planctomycetota bacterium]
MHLHARWALLSLVFVSAAIHAATLDFATYIGGNNFEQARDVFVDSAGNISVTGGTQSSDFFRPTTTITGTGPATTGSAGPMKVFVMKFNPSGQLLWSTLLAGPSYYRAYAIEVDPSGFVYVGGRAGGGFPVTSGALQTTFAGDSNPNGLYGKQDGFVAKLKPDGSALVWSTYFGDSSMGVVHDIAVDAGGSVYLSFTSDVDCPYITPGAAQTVRKGPDCVFAKLKTDGSGVAWATYVGGSGDDTMAHPDVRVDAAGNVWFMTNTNSKDAPFTATAAQKTFGGGNADLLIGQIAADGQRLLYCTYLGGAGTEYDEGHQLAIDAAGNYYVATVSNFADLPLSTNAYQRTVRGQGDIYVGKFSTSTGLIAGTYIGGTGADFTQGIGLDSQGNITIGGYTASTNFPVLNAVQSAHRGVNDAVAVTLKPDLSGLIFSTYLGGTGDDMGRMSVVAPNGTIYTVGQCASGFPVTNTAYDTTYGGAHYDAFLAKITVSGAATAPSITQHPASTAVAAGQTATFTVAANGTAPLSYQWQKNSVNISGATAASYTTPATTLADNGATFRCIVSNSAGSATSNSATLTVNSVANRSPVISSPASAAPNPAQTGQSIAFSVAASDPDGDPLSYAWNFADSTSGTGASTTHTYTAAGTYTATVSVSDGRGGTATSSISVVVNAAPPPPPPPPVSNLLIDPGFENNGQNWMKTANGGRAIVTTMAHSGTKSQRMIASNLYPREVYQDVRVSAGATYVAAGWIKTTGINNARIEVLWLNQSPGTDAIPAGALIRSDLVGQAATTQEWTRHEKTFTSPAGAVVVRFRLWMAVEADNLGTAWFDDLELNGPAAATSASSEAAAQTSATAMEVSVKKFSAAINLAQPQKDALKLAGVISNVPADFKPEGCAVQIDVAGVQADYTLNSKAAGRSKSGSLQLKFKATKKAPFKGGEVPFQLSIGRGSFSETWSDAGVSLEGESQLPVTIYFDGREYFGTVDARGSTRQAKSAKLISSSR